MAWSGRGEPGHWSRSGRPVDLYDFIVVGEHLLRSLRREGSWTRRSDALPAFHPSRAASWISAGGSTLGWGGALHPSLQRELEQEVYLLEVELDTLAGLPHGISRHQAVPRVPSVTRDLSLLITRDVPYGAVMDTLSSVDAPAPVRFDALDRYEGKPLADGEISLTVRITLEPLERTLTDEETEAYRRSLVAALQTGLGVRIRS
jgi:phenylalanyl-tRNA synthetase beta chain